MKNLSVIEEKKEEEKPLEPASNLITPNAASSKATAPKATAPIAISSKRQNAPRIHENMELYEMNKLLKIIIEERPLKLWSERAHDDKIRLNHKIIKILNFISGNDLKSMLKDLFKNKKLQLGRFSREYRTLKKIAPHFNDKIKPKQKHFFLKGFVISRFTQKETKKFGFKFSKFLWNSCLNSRIRKPGGRPLYKNYMRKKIHNFLEYNSEISASRTTTHVFIPEKIRKQGPCPQPNDDPARLLHHEAECRRRAGAGELAGLQPAAPLRPG